MAGLFRWALDEPGPDKPDLVSIVSLCTPREKYTDEELQKLVDFAKRVTERYDRMFHYRRGANLIFFDKMDDGKWMRKRMTWEMGPFYSDTLDQAIEIMGR